MTRRIDRFKITVSSKNKIVLAIYYDGLIQRETILLIDTYLNEDGSYSINDDDPLFDVTGLICDD